MKFLSTLLDGVTEYETLVSAVERHNTPAAGTGVSGTLSSAEELEEETG